MKSKSFSLATELEGTTVHRHETLGYPSRLMISASALLLLMVLWAVLPFSSSVKWMLSLLLSLVALLALFWCSRSIAGAREQSLHVQNTLGVAAGNIPIKLRTHMPLVLVIGDGLPALFDRAGETRNAYVGDSCIWLRVDQPQDLPQLAVAVKQWRDGRVPDGILLSVAPALYSDADALSQRLQLARQAAADTARLLGKRIPGYVAVYQRLIPGAAKNPQPTWYGISSGRPLEEDIRFSPILRAAENQFGRTTDSRSVATHAAALTSVIDWTRRTVLSVLADAKAPTIPWPLFGAGWIDYGPASRSENPWERDVQTQTCVTRAEAIESSTPWPLPQPLIEAMPRRYWISPRVLFFLHTIMLLAGAAAIAFWGAAKNNEALLNRIGNDLDHYWTTPTDHQAAKRDALQRLVADRDSLDRYARLGVPLRLAFGMYRGSQLIPQLNEAIAAYAPPPPPPAVVTLDSLSLFDSGKAQLKIGSNRVMVSALDMIRKNPHKRILVAGYTDNTGIPDNNLKLSTERAQAVRDWLVDASGIPVTQFAIQGYGITHPIASNDTSEGRARNRRVEITLVPDSDK